MSDERTMIPMQPLPEMIRAWVRIGVLDPAWLGLADELENNQ